jgi:hypothetical protein
MRGEAWTDYELQALYDVVNDVDWFEKARNRISFRTDAAIRTRMCQLREEAGIVPHNTRSRASSWRVTESQLAQRASDRLLERIHEFA